MVLLHADTKITKSQTSALALSQRSLATGEKRYDKIKWSIGLVSKKKKMSFFPSKSKYMFLKARSL